MEETNISPVIADSLFSSTAVHLKENQGSQVSLFLTQKISLLVYVYL